MSQIFPDLNPYIHMLKLNLGRMTRQGKPSPRTITQWVGFASWSIKNFHETNLDAELTQYIGEQASDWATDYMAEMAQESSAAAAYHYLSAINPIALLKPLALAATSVWNDMALNQAMCSIWQTHQSQCKWLDNYNDMDLQTFHCECHGKGHACPLTGIETRLQAQVLDAKVFSAASTGAAKTLLPGASEAAQSLEYTKGLADRAHDFYQEVSQIADFASDAPTEACTALFEGMVGPARDIVTELHQSAVDGPNGKGCKRSQASIALILGELTMTANGGIIYDSPNEIGLDFTQYPKTLAVLSSPVGVSFIAGALHGLSV